MEGEEKPERNRKDFILFGKNLAEIPCFRNSWLYGISGGIGTGLIYFLFTSKPQIATHVGFSSTMAITLIYWSCCRYNLNRQAAEFQRVKEYVEKKALLKETKMEKLSGVEIAEVSHKTDATV